MQADLIPEHALVSRCARVELRERDADRVESLVSRPLDWEYVVDVARYNRVTPLVYKGLNETCETSVPDEVMTELRDRYQSNARHNFALAGELHEILRACGERDLRVLPFKGPVLSAAVYGDIGLRSFDDLDLLVAADHISEVTTLLEDRGFELTEPVPRLDDSALLGGFGTLPMVSEYPLQRERDGVRAEVRWQVGQFDRPFGLEFETLWRNRHEVHVAGQPVEALSSADRLLVLAYHGTKHLWTELKWVCDVAEWVRTNADAPWSALFERSARYGVERRLLVSLVLAEVLLDIDLPSVAENRLSRDERVRPLARKAAEQYNSYVHGPTPPAPGDLSQWRSAWYNAQATDSPNTALSVLGRTLLNLFTPTLGDYSVYPLPGSLHSAYYLVRPIRLIALTINDRLTRQPNSRGPESPK